MGVLLLFVFSPLSLTIGAGLDHEVAHGCGQVAQGMLHVALRHAGELRSACMHRCYNRCQLATIPPCDATHQATRADRHDSGASLATARAHAGPLQPQSAARQPPLSSQQKLTADFKTAAKDLCFVEVVLGSFFVCGARRRLQPSVQGVAVPDGACIKLVPSSTRPPPPLDDQ